MSIDPQQVAYDERGLVPAILQDYRTGRVLMMAWMNRTALERTLETGEAWFWSRSRHELWHKGATSGHTQRVLDVTTDCDDDTVLVLVEPQGPACHRGTTSCFGGGRTATSSVITELWARIRERQQEMPESSYTTYLFGSGLDKILKKVGEEATEVVIAAKNRDRDELVAETADLTYHLLVMLAEQGVAPEEIERELERRYHDRGGAQR